MAQNASPDNTDTRHTDGDDNNNINNNNINNARATQNVKPYYAILGITPSATAEDVKRAYRRRALELHPDRAGSGSTEKFQFLQHAYSVLSDEQKRRVYDQFGERGLEMPGLEQFAAVLNGQLFGAAAFTVVLLLVVLLIIFFAFLCVRVDHTVQWKWTSVWVPFYIFAALVGVPTFISLIMSLSSFFSSLIFGVESTDENTNNNNNNGNGGASSAGNSSSRGGGEGPSPSSFEDGDSKRSDTQTRRFLSICSSLTLLGYLAFFIGISAGLQKDMNGKRSEVNWWLYFIPAFIAEGVTLVTTLFTTIYERFGIGNKTRIFAGVPQYLLIFWSFSDVLIVLSRAALLALIAAKVSGDFETHSIIRNSYGSEHKVGVSGDLSWWVVFIPAYVMCFLYIILYTLSSLAQRNAVARALGASEADVKEMGAVFCVIGVQSCIGAFFAVGVTYASVFMIIARLSGTNIRLDYCLIPLFFMLSVLFLGICCGACVFCVGARSLKADMEDFRAAAEEEANNESLKTNYGSRGQQWASSSPNPTNHAAAVHVSAGRSDSNQPVLSIEAGPVGSGPVFSEVDTPNA